KDNPAALMANLDALTLYGWLVSGLGEPPVSGEESSPGTVLAAGLGGLAAMSGASVATEGLNEVAASVNAAVNEGVDEQKTVVKPPLRPAPLPPPPDRPEQTTSLRRALPIAVAFFGGTLAMIIGKTGVLHPFFDRALHTGALPGIAALALCWGAFACLRLKRFVEDTPTSRIRSLAMGLVEVQGRAIRRYALVAPMTQGACVWYRLRKYRRDNRNNWMLASQSDSNHVPFVLDDGSGRVVVDPAGATIKVKTEQTGFPGESTLIGAAVDGGPDEKWIEELIYEGTSLYVLGYARPVRGVGPGLRERTVEALRRLKLDPRALHRYDANRDGRLDADEWQAAREDAERLAAAEQLRVREVPSADHALLGKPPRGLPFLIAEGQTGTELAGRYGWLGVVLLVLGVAAFGFALKLSLEFFGLI
ncbi:MAG: E3 ubiquitin ligase family protein, partial [Desulfuromonadales bacterium]|nr:E3 ubiquitin ligase family protein [Desulfuromonadales bacterium]